MVEGPARAGSGAADGVGLRRVAALDGLRGVAVAAVLLFHAGHLTGGYLGVDLFFVLSGYLITSLLVVEWQATGRIDLRAFWARRARRLLPALLVLVGAVGLAARWEVLPAARGDLRGAGLATLLQIANWRAIGTGDGYWDRPLLPSWLAHTWSLSVEEQVYLVWPLVVVVVTAGVGRLVRPPASRRAGAIRLTRVALALALVSGLGTVAAALAGVDRERLYLGTDTRAAAVLLGAWAAGRRLVVEPSLPLTAARRRQLAWGAVAAAGLLAVCWARLDGGSAVLHRGGLLACGLAAVVVVVDLTTPGRSLVAPVLRAPPLRALGAISYGLYLVHWPIFLALRPGRVGLGGWALTGVRVGASVLVAAASFVLVERPVRLRRWPVPMTRLAPAGYAVAALLLLVGTTGAVEGGPVGSPPVAAAVPTVPPPGAPAPVRVLVVGDSVGQALAVEGLAPGGDLVVVDRSVVGCTRLLDVGDESRAPVRNCSAGWPAAVAEVEPDAVLVLFGAWSGVVPQEVGGEEVFPCTSAYDGRWRARLEGAVDVLSSGGARVALATAPTAAQEEFKGDDPDRFDERQACANQVVEEVAAARDEAAVVDLAGWVCPPGRGCRTEVEGVELRPDGLHFRQGGAEVVGRWLAPRLAALVRDRGPSAGG